jgi:enterochelin esterase-like enzyme
MKRLSVAVMLVWLVCSFALAQETGRGAGAAPAAGRGMGGGRGPAVVSPEVRPDRTVILRIAAPLARSVTVSGEIMGTNPPAALTPDANGVWSITLGPLEPEVYSYGFSVDGMTVNDQRTSYVKPSSSYTSQVVVPGDGPRFYDPRPVPHGEVRIVTYEAKTLNGMTRRMRVYTPAGYESGNKKYPVLYLFHGAGDWDVAWTDVGRANYILDNLIADGKAKPMIVVMPSIFQQAALGTGAMAPAAARGAAPAAAPGAPAAARGNAPTPATGPGAAAAAPAAGQDDGFTKELLADIMPLMQKKYRILTGPDNTAIAGLSMGGAQSLRTGLAHLETFHYVIGLSSAVALGGGGRGAARAGGAAPAAAAAAVAPDPTAAYPALMADVAGANKKLKLFAMYCGKQDSLVINGNKALSAALLAKGVKLQYTETEGGHWFIVWRQNLRDFAPLLFQ